jgi:hypothetical protein
MCRARQGLNTSVGPSRSTFHQPGGRHRQHVTLLLRRRSDDPRHTARRPSIYSAVDGSRRDVHRQAGEARQPIACECVRTQRGSDMWVRGLCRPVFASYSGEVGPSWGERSRPAGGATCVPISIDRPRRLRITSPCRRSMPRRFIWDDDVLGRSDLFIIWMTLGRASRLMTPA